MAFRPGPAFLAPRYARASQGVTPAPGLRPRPGSRCLRTRNRCITSATDNDLILATVADEVNAGLCDSSIKSFREPVSSIREPVSSIHSLLLR
jgi:hypothetical protein